MRLCIETSALSRPGSERGLGRYTRACLEAATAGGAEVAQLQLAPRAGRVAELLDLAARSVKLRRVDHELLHLTHPYAWGYSRAPTVVSVLDTIPLDMASHRRTGAKARLFFALASRAEAVLTLSHFSAERIAHHLAVPREKIFVAPLPPEPVFGSPPSGEPCPGVPDGFILALVDMASPDPRKRADWIAPLARALARSDLTLVVVGAGTDARSSELGPAIGLGRLEDESLNVLMQAAIAFLYFSSYEGQGLPPLEAMACGLPVVATANTAITEVVGSAGHLIAEPANNWSSSGPASPSEDVREIQSALVEACVRVASDAAERESLSRRGVERAAKFTRSSFRHGLFDAYEAALCASD